MTKQEIFDKVCDHLMTQMAKSKLQGGCDLCAYRDADGLSCAVGCLIPDELYSDKIEGCDVYEIAPTLEKIGVEKHLDFLNSLQRIHDELTPEGWQRELKKLAVEENLTQPKSIQ